MNFEPRLSHRASLRARPGIRTFAILLAALTVFAIPSAGKEKKDAAKKTSPRVLFTAPLGIARGAKTKLLIRGQSLSGATEVRCELAGKTLTASIKSKSKSPPPAPLTADAVGDTQIEIELDLPADAPPGDAKIVVVTPDGQAPARALRTFAADVLTAEKEPNGGFANAQEIHAPTTVQGTIGEANDVDVFRFKANKGQKLSAHVIAAQRGSPLDSLLTLYDANHHVIASNDDTDTSDSALDLPLPADGEYFISLTDANGGGGRLFAYLLDVSVK